MEFDILLLLGVALGENDAPTDELRARVDAAVAAYHRLGGLLIMPCGGCTRGHQRTEAEVMTELLLAAGIPAEDIRPESASRTTVENFRNARKLLGGRGTVLVVTSDYHLRRAVRTARRAGLQARGEGAVLPHNDDWRYRRRQEVRWSIELSLDWLDEPDSRPAWGKKVMEAIFGKPL